MSAEAFGLAPAGAHRYLLFDVFAPEPLSGNPLAVFTSSAGLSDAAMQRAANELHLSESVFLELGGGQARVRIFTPAAELPFAGHPVLGAGFAAARILEVESVEVLTARASVTVSVQDEVAAMRQPLPAPIAPPDPAGLGAALRLDGVPDPVAYENGPAHVYVELESARSLAALDPDLAALARLGEWLVTCFAGTEDGVGTRTFLPALGVDEDPATGSAAGPLALHLCRRGLAPWGAWLRIAQGAGLGRPSLIEARVDGDRDQVREVHVRGAVRLVGEGRLRIPQQPS